MNDEIKKLWDQLDYVLHGKHLSSMTQMGLTIMLSIKTSMKIRITTSEWTVTISNNVHNNMCIIDLEEFMPWCRTSSLPSETYITEIKYLPLVWGIKFMNDIIEKFFYNKCSVYYHPKLKIRHFSVELKETDFVNIFSKIQYGDD